MKFLLTLVFISLAPIVQAQIVDTLSNLPDSTSLYAPRYSNPGQWGYILGQNSSYRQQFAEKYYVAGSKTVNGLIAHLTGVFEHPNNYVEFNVYQVAENGLPGNRLGGKQIFYKDLDLSGNGMLVTFNTPITIQDSFFVTFNVLDYLHGGFEGDTLGLLAGEPGSRSSEDLANFGRNAIQAHNHNREDWKDFFTQNFTPIATHFALFPLVESNEITTLDSETSKVQIKVYPNPADDWLYLSLPDQYEKVSVYNLRGEIMYQEHRNKTLEVINVENWVAGSYLVHIQVEKNQQLFERIIIR